MIYLLFLSFFSYGFTPSEKVFDIGESTPRWHENKSDKPIRKSYEFKVQGNIEPRNGVFEAQEDPIKLPITKGKDKKLNLYRGDILKARINQDIIAYEGSISPIRGIVTEGSFKGSYVIGNATMDTKTKSISIFFDTLRLKESDNEFKIEAYVQAANGTTGIIGEYESHYWSYFWAEVLANGVSGYAEASKDRENSIYGFSKAEVSPQNSALGAISESAKSTAEKFRERSRIAPEFSKSSGPHNIQIFLIKGPNDI